MKIKYLLTIFLYIFLSHAYAANEGIPLAHIEPDITNQESLQRGARLYMNYCAACHSLKYFRYNTLAQSLDVSPDLVANNLIFTTAKITDTVRNALSPKQAKQWFGVAPPDLSLEVSFRGADWVYTYLKSFYKDKQRPFGSNNLLFHDVSMPNILAPLQGEQIAIYHTKNIIFNDKPQQINTIEYLTIAKQGEMTQYQFDAALYDIVNFLSLVADPIKPEREAIGYFVLGFLSILLVIAYLLKKNYWQALKK